VTRPNRLRRLDQKWGPRAMRRAAEDSGPCGEASAHRRQALQEG
jgi:hypothetical protein